MSRVADALTAMRHALLLSIAASLASFAAACSSTDASTPPSSSTASSTATTTGAGGSGGSAASGGAGGTTAAGGSGGGGAGGSAGGGGGAAEFIPTPGDIHYGAHQPLPSGESILFNDWTSAPNRVLAMKPDGSAAGEVFHAYRIWSMGATPSGDRIAFACGDPKQKQHYGLDLGDAIQHSWIYDAATESIALASHGNINDECHVFGPGQKSLYVCRRYDFQPDFSSKGYRIGRIDLASLAFAFLAPESASEMTLQPAPTGDGASLFFTRIVLAGGKQKRYLSKEALPPGPSVDVRTDAGGPRLSPDGARMLYSDYTDKGTLWSSKLDGTDPIKVVNGQATGARYSPDGLRIVYTMRDDLANCQHIEIAKSDGSEADNPTRIRDCTVTGEDITQVDWINRKP